MKAKLNQNLDDQKKQVQVIEETIGMTKRGYAGSLRELEKISEEIRKARRRCKRGKPDDADAACFSIPNICGQQRRKAIWKTRLGDG
jgi:hypothetical protein